MKPGKHDLPATFRRVQWTWGEDLEGHVTGSVHPCLRGPRVLLRHVGLFKIEISYQMGRGKDWAGRTWGCEKRKAEVYRYELWQVGPRRSPGRTHLFQRSLLCGLRRSQLLHRGPLVLVFF